MLKAIQPKRLLNTKKLMRDLVATAEKAGRRMVDDLKKPTRTWDRKVDFYMQVRNSTNGVIEVFAGTTNEIYGYVSRGTKPHLIRPKRARVLGFRGGYRAKTSPGRLSSGAGGASGGFFSAKVVRHPGNKPRYFEETVAAQNQPLFERDMQAVFTRAAEETYE